MPGLLSSLNCSDNRGSSERGGGPFFSSEERDPHDIPCKAVGRASAPVARADRAQGRRTAGYCGEMSDQNVALVRKAVDALNRRDFDDLLGLLGPDVVWEALEGVTGIGEL